jgi:hypothetical protein
MYRGMDATNAPTVKSKLETLVALARLLEKVDHSTQALAADQYRSLIERVKALLADDLPADALNAIVAHFPATAELYENLNYAHAGLVRAPLEQAVEAERLALQAIARWRRVPH